MHIRANPVFFDGSSKIFDARAYFRPEIGSGGRSLLFDPSKIVSKRSPGVSVSLLDWCIRRGKSRHSLNHCIKAQSVSLLTLIAAIGSRCLRFRLGSPGAWCGSYSHMRRLDNCHRAGQLLTLIANEIHDCSD